MTLINGWEFAFLLVLIMVLIGPQRLPEYTAHLAKLVRRAREFARGARSQVREELGPEFDDVDWKQFDPRQYDPRRIVRDALTEPLGDEKSPEGEQKVKSAQPLNRDRDSPAPFDPEAT